MLKLNYRFHVLSSSVKQIALVWEHLGFLDVLELSILLKKEWGQQFHSNFSVTVLKYNATFVKQPLFKPCVAFDRNVDFKSKNGTVHHAAFNFLL